MRVRAGMAAAMCVGMWVCGAKAQQAGPQVMGTVATRDALVTGGLEVRGEQANLMTNVSVTAYDRTAPIALTRGGEVLVCATSQFHLLHSGAGPSLLFALDRGAVEIRTPGEAQDVILTPDLRFTMESPGALDVRLRVTSGGDTCVENAGAAAPAVDVSDAFSNASYRLEPGQHVLFEHGSLHEVVDRESSSCGCPPATVEVAAGASAAVSAEARNPFPVAQSAGLAPLTPAPGNASPAGEKHTQISSTLAYGAGQADSTAVPAAPPPAPAVVSTTPPPAPPGATDLAHIVGRFFHKLFHRHG
jgi:hypothetical protein